MDTTQLCYVAVVPKKDEHQQAAYKKEQKPAKPQDGSTLVKINCEKESNRNQEQTQACQSRVGFHYFSINQVWWVGSRIYAVGKTLYACYYFLNSWVSRKGKEGQVFEYQFLKL
jgi:hypothetical protein